MIPKLSLSPIALIVFSWVALTSLAVAEEWSCGVHFESQCFESACSADGHKDDGNTKPVFAQFDDSGKFLICMYSGCFEGKGRVLTTSPFLSIMKERVSWTGTNARETDVFIVLERNELIGMFKADTFVQPIVCEVVGGTE